jgi:lipoate-protein ligase B
MIENVKHSGLIRQLEENCIFEAPIGCFLGLLPYQRALDLQHKIHEAVVEKRSPGIILGLEHPPTITMGLHAKEQDLFVSGRMRENSPGICLERTDRGGQITGHEPGQLVIYPILSIGRSGVRKFVRLAEQATVQVLRNQGLESRTDSARPGVWIEDRKICALGFRIRKKVAMHGLALNINNDLSIFGNFIPCGLQGISMTSVQQELGRRLVLSDVFHQWLKAFHELSGMTLLEWNQ